MKASISEDGTLVVRGETAQESLALTAWNMLWARRRAGFRVEVVESTRPVQAQEEDVWPPSHPMSLSLA